MARFVVIYRPGGFKLTPFAFLTGIQNPASLEKQFPITLPVTQGDCGEQIIPIQFSFLRGFHTGLLEAGPAPVTLRYPASAVREDRIFAGEIR